MWDERYSGTEFAFGTEPNDFLRETFEQIPVGGHKDRGVAITTQVADLADYNFGQDKWDAIVSIWAHVPETVRQYVHAQVGTALKPEGVFIVEAYTERQLETEAVGGPLASQRERFGALENFQHELVGLNEVIGIEKLRMVSEGKRHQGLSAVVQFVGKKTSN